MVQSDEASTISLTRRRLLATASTAGLGLSIGPSASSYAAAKTPDVHVTVDLSAAKMVSNFAIGLTHTHGFWEFGHPDAVNRVKQLLEDAHIRYQNQHIMGWGADNPNPEPGVYDWSTLDARMDLIRSMDNTIPVITLCTAPGWMKTTGQDWDTNDRVADEHVEDFAILCREVALRYSDVEYFQVWNEFKGYRFWEGSVETGKDMERFTDMYAAVHAAVESVRPDANIGGPYMPMEGRDVMARDLDDVEYWLANSPGADFFTYDGWVEGYPPGGNTEEWMMSRTGFFGDLTDQFATVTDLPMWISEYYAGRGDNAEFTAANYASTYYHSLMSGTHRALLWHNDPSLREIWDPAGYGELFSDTQSAVGGQPTLHYFVVRAFNQHFGPGTQLYETKSSSDDIEVLASLDKTILINRRSDPVLVDLDGAQLSLQAYEVRVVNTPEVSFATAMLLVNGYFEGGVLTRRDRQRMLAHLSVAKRMADRGHTAQAHRALDRFGELAAGVADQDARAELLAVSEALRRQL